LTTAARDTALVYLTGTAAQQEATRRHGSIDQWGDVGEVRIDEATVGKPG
jgi:hypothetical protein